MAPEFKPGPVPKEALDYFRAKQLKPSFDYQDVWNKEHANAFTVAKAASLDVLTDIRNELDRALAEGRTFEQFKKDLQPRLEARGWWGKRTVTDPLTGEKVKAQLGSPRRLKVIYQTNLRADRAAGQWERAQRTKKALPYFTYRLGPSQKHRDHHVAIQGTTLPVDDPFWDSHFPPNGYGCKCWLLQITKRAADKLPDSKRVTPKIEEITHINRRTGEIQTSPADVDPNFNHNPGKHRERILKEHLKRSETRFKETVKRPDRKAPVSAGLDIRARGDVGRAAKHVLQKIDQIHDDGKLPKIPLGINSRMKALGGYYHSGSGRAVKISIRTTGNDYKELTIAHEIGHFIDHQALFRPGFFATSHSPALSPFKEAVKKSKAYREIIERKSKSRSLKELHYYNYLLDDAELFARAYSQYVAYKTKDPILLNQIESERKLESYQLWEVDDFKPISESIDTLFKSKGWL